MRSKRSKPVAPDFDDAIEKRQCAGKHYKVGQARRTGTRQHRPDSYQRPNISFFQALHDCTGVVVGGGGSETGSAGVSRGVWGSKSKISAYRPQFIAVSNCRSTSS